MIKVYLEDLQRIVDDLNERSNPVIQEIYFSYPKAIEVHYDFCKIVVKLNTVHKFNKSNACGVCITSKMYLTIEEVETLNLFKELLDAFEKSQL